jgi:hypothetical protein
MKAIVIEEETFDRIFNDFAKDVDLAAFEARLADPREWSQLDEAKRRWVYALRVAQDRLRRER